MSYWITLISLFVFIGLIIVTMCFDKKQGKKNTTRDKIAGVGIIFFICVLSVITAIICIDIPSALSGGEVLYANELPTTVRCGCYASIAVTNNDELKHLQGCNWNKYEKYGNYRIRYTKLHKFVLDVEKLD